MSKDQIVEAEAVEIDVEGSVPETEQDDKFITINRQAAYYKVQRAGGFVRTKVAYFVAGAVAAVGTLAIVAAVKNEDNVTTPEMETID